MSSNVQGACAVFKLGLMTGGYYFGTGTVRSVGTADTFKAALYYQGTGLGYATTVYSATGEVSGSGYTAGGKTVTNATAPTTSGATAYWTPSANIQWTSLTISSNFDCWLLYDSTQSNAAVVVFTFTPQTVTAGTFTITMPANAAGTALIQIS